MSAAWSPADRQTPPPPTTAGPAALDPAALASPAVPAGPAQVRVDRPRVQRLSPDNDGGCGTGSGPLPFSRSRLRADTPGCDQIVHLNNAGAALPPQPVVDRMIDHLRLEAVRGGYEAAAAVAAEVTRGRSDLGSLVGTTAQRVAFTESATAGLHRVLSTLQLHRGDRVLVAGSEYASTVLPLLQLSRRLGVRIEFLPDGPDGSTDPEAVGRLLDDDVRLVCAVHAPSHNGLVNDVAAIGRQLSGSRAWYLVDACQSLGQLPLDMTDIGCDFLIASGRKFLRGPRGSGILAVSDRVLTELDAFPVDIVGGSWTSPDSYLLRTDASRFESFERSVAVTLGLLEAVRYANACGIDELRHAIARNAEYLRSHLGAFGQWRVTDRGRVRSGIVTATHRSVPAGRVVALLAAAGINAHEVPGASNPRELGSGPVLRLSPHAYNTRAELDRTLAVLADL